VLDFTGPIEIFSHVTLNKNPDDPDRVYKITTISRGSTIRAANSLTVQWISQSKMPCASYSNSIFSWSQELLLRSSRLTISRKSRDAAGHFFSKLPPKGLNGEHRILFSVCTGAFFLGAAGLLGGSEATMHHRAQMRLLAQVMES
jgi:hypothetical protein